MTSSFNLWDFFWPQPKVSLEEAEGAESDIDGDTPQPSEAQRNAPPTSVETIYRFLASDKLLPNRVQVGCMHIGVEFKVSEGKIRSGRVSKINAQSPIRTLGAPDLTETIDGETPGDDGYSNILSGGAPYALAITFESYNTQQMPFDTQIALTGLSLASHKPNAPRHFHLRQQVLQYNASVHPKSPSGIATLMRPMIFNDSAGLPFFSSVDAIGFDSHHLRTLVRVVVDGGARARRYSTLFSATDFGLRPLLNNQACASDMRRFVRVPSSYSYSDLLARVHIYLVERELATARVPIERADLSVYALPTGSNEVIFIAEELDLVIEFIDNNLVDVHPIFDPLDLHATLEPFEHENWVEAWSKTMGDPTSSNKRVLSCKATFAIHYIRFSRHTVAGEYQTHLRLQANADLIRTLSTSARTERSIGPNVILSLDGERDSGGAGEEEDSDDEEVSVMFTTEAAEESKGSESTTQAYEDVNIVGGQSAPNSLGADGGVYIPSSLYHNGDYDGTTITDIGDSPRQNQQSEEMEMTSVFQSDKVDE